MLVFSFNRRGLRGLDVNEAGFSARISVVFGRFIDGSDDSDDTDIAAGREPAVNTAGTLLVNTGCALLAPKWKVKLLIPPCAAVMGI
jgi:hypothetical protein